MFGVVRTPPGGAVKVRSFGWAGPPPTQGLYQHGDVWGVVSIPEVGGRAQECFRGRGRAASGVSARRSELCTLVGAEAPFAVIVIVGCGRAPHLPIAAAHAGTALMLVAQEGEGEDTGGPLRVPANSGHGCGARDMGQGAGRHLRPPPGNDTMRTLTNHAH